MYVWNQEGDDVQYLENSGVCMVGMGAILYVWYLEGDGICMVGMGK